MFNYPERCCTLSLLCSADGSDRFDLDDIKFAGEGGNERTHHSPKLEPTGELWWQFFVQNGQHKIQKQIFDRVVQFCFSPFLLDSFSTGF